MCIRDSHITGGGLADNFSRILRDKKYGAELTGIFPPLPFMLKVQELGNVPEEQAYLLWNMGNGMLLAVNKDQAQKILAEISKQNYQAKICGYITGKPQIDIMTAGNHPQQLTYRY